MSFLKELHHIAIICSDYERSKKFYTSVLGFKVIREEFRKERASFKLDLCLDDHYLIELFSFPQPSPRPTSPEATGLRHLAFSVSDMEAAIDMLRLHGVIVEPVRVDEFTGKHFTFFRDPDDLPIEIYEK
jgi:glyoxylase I family protein